MNPCPLCGGNSSLSLLVAPDVPTHHVLARHRVVESVDFHEIAIVSCGDCGHVFNAAFDESSVNLLYAVHTATNAPVSESMLRDLEKVAEFILASRPRPARILEIGCGVGALARLLVGHADSLDLIEPNLSISVESFNDRRIKFLPGMFPEASHGQKYDLIVCRQVLEHINRPISFLEAIRSHLAPKGEAYIEIPRADYIVDSASLVDFHYMHVQYFTANTFEQSLARAGFLPVRSWTLKDGHDMGYMVEPSAPSTITRRAETTDFVGLRERLQVRWDAGKKRLDGLGSEFALYGACAYSQSFLGLYPEMQAPVAMFDDTAAYRDQEVYHRSWRIPIVRPTTASLKGIRGVIISAYLHDRPIAERLAGLGYSGPILTLRSDQDAGASAPPSFFALR